MRTFGLFTLALLFASLVALLPFGSSDAEAAVLITEIMYDLSGTDTGREWVEITNTGSSPVDVSGYKFFEANTNHTLTLISGNGTIQSGSSIVIADDPTKFKLDWPSFSGTLFDSSFSLSNTGESLAIKDGALAIVNSVTYDPSTGAAGDGTTLQWNGSIFAPATPTPGTYTDVSVSSTDTAESVSSPAIAAATSSSGGSAEYLPIPDLHISTGGDHTVSAGADTAFSAIVYDGRGNRRDDAMVTWSFGDGMRRTGASVFHSYYDPGEYLVIVRASTSDGGDALVENIITAKDANLRIASISSRGITLMNKSSRTLDLSLWRLSVGGKEFKIPTDTHILAGHSILFPSQVIELPITGSAMLLYPNGEVAAIYPSASGGQPSSGATSYQERQTVEPITSTKTNIQTHEEAIAAPTATTELAAVGATVLPTPASSETSPADKRMSGLFRSPWTLGFFGIMALAGSAFIFL